MALEVDTVHLYPLDNASQHHTNKYEIVHNTQPTSVLRRGQPFFLALRFKDRLYRDHSDVVKLVFNYSLAGTGATPMEGTRGVAPLTRREVFTGDSTRWDVRVKGCDGDTLSLEVIVSILAGLAGTGAPPMEGTQGVDPLTRRAVFTGDSTRWDVRVKGCDGDTLSLEVFVSILAGLAGTGAAPMEGTRGVAPLTRRAVLTGDSTRWDVRVKGCDGDTLSLEVFVSILAGLAGTGATPMEGTRGVAPLTRRAVFTGHSTRWDVRVKGCDGDTLSLEVIVSILAGLAGTGATPKEGTRGVAPLTRRAVLTGDLTRWDVRVKGCDGDTLSLEVIVTILAGLAGTGATPMEGTRGVAPLTRRAVFTGDSTRWDVRVKGCDGDTLSLEVQSPANAPVGTWSMEVHTSLQSSQAGDKVVFKYPDMIFLLFNPWMKNDQVYMPEERLLDEYVLSDVGKIWVGPMASSRGREWVFGQFDAVVLPAAMLVLERTGLKGYAFGDPVKVTRALSKLINNNDDQGVLEGRWDGEYEDGTAPSAWTGSVPILEQYLNTGVEVKYGQCWVFAGVLTTVCRALGIPSRVVSNLVSAHDANESLTIDRYYSTDNEEIPFDPRNLEGGADSIWNYHVWNDVWMARPDLARSGYGGWQAIDATPQETSDGVYQCGPASVEAVRKGEVGLKYDVGFLLASVNADLVRWKEDPDADDGFSKIDCNRYHIGRMLLTKHPYVFDPNGDSDKEDITHQYKPSEGSKDERASYYLAAQGKPRAKRFLDVPDAATTNVSFELKELDKINIGESFNIEVNLKNDSNEVKTIQASLSASSMYYNGVKAKLIKKSSGVFKLQPKSTEFLRLTIKADEYLDKLVEYCIIKFYTIATVMETKQTWAGEDDFQVIKPSLQIGVSPELPVGLSARVSFQFKNPLQKSLTNCKFSWEGPGLCKSQKIPYRNIGPGEEAKLEIMFTPMFAGPHKLIAAFDSKELTDITGSTHVEVTEE